MAQMLRNIVRYGSGLKSLALPIQHQSVGLRATGTRSLWHMSKSSVVSNCHSCGCGLGGGCTCGSQKRFASTNGEKALLEFLQEEIESEKKSLAGHLPSQLDSFQIKYESAEVELSKQASNEKILIKFNVNHTVDEENFEDDFEEGAEHGQERRQEKQEPAKMRSTPNFEIDIVRGDTTLSMTCSYINTPAAEGEYDDIFGIEELTIFKGPHSEKVYACAGDMLDGYFYDLLMNLLSEKGVTDEFAHKLSELATQYEQSLFVNLLQDTKKFFEVK